MDDFRRDLAAAVPRLRVFARCLARSAHLADDLVQDTMMLALRAQARFAPGSNLEAWLFTILRNRFRTIARRRRAAPEVQAGDDEIARARVGPAFQEAYVEVRAFRDAFGRLGAGHREVLVLVGVHGLTYEQVAEVCGCEVGTVKSRLSRARAALKAMLLGEEGVVGPVAPRAAPRCGPEPAPAGRPGPPSAVPQAGRAPPARPDGAAGERRAESPWGRLPGSRRPAPPRRVGPAGPLGTNLERRSSMRETMLASAAALTLALGLPSAASAQAAAAEKPLRQAEVIPLSELRYDDLYAQGWRTEEIWDAEVHGPNGQEIGEVENVIVGPDGRILSIIAEVGGVWDVGDTHVNIPWREVKVGPGFERVTVPVTRENVEDYSLFRDGYLTGTETKTTQVVDDDLRTGPRAWKLTELTGDPVLLKDGTGYGYVDDVIFSREGEIKAVVVRPDLTWGAPGYYAYPYYGYGYAWSPGLDYYELPYDRTEIGGVERFDYERLDDDVLAADD